MNSDLKENNKNEYNINEKSDNDNLLLKNGDNKQNKKVTNIINNSIENINTEKNIAEEQKNDVFDKNFLNDYYKNEDLKNTNKKSKDGKEILDINELLYKSEEEIPIILDILDENFENFTKSKISSRDFGIIKAYAANTSQGIVRDYNEDRVSIIINMVKPKNCNLSDIDWPKISYFGIFDGHAGNKCTDYLKDNLIKKISNNMFFPKDIKNAIKFGFQSAERDFLENYAVKNNKIIDKSGSCALILLTVDNLVYIANTGDSRCLISCKKGKILKDVTRDHKPNYPYEKERIIKNKGNIYQSEAPIDIEINDEEDKFFLDKVILGPYRVSPGRLSVSRTIGDAEAKIVKFGGNPNVIISEPDIFVFDLDKDDIDFFILGCDGIYDQLSSKEVLDCAWMVFSDLSHRFNDDLNANCGNVVDMILKMSMIRKSFDNITCLIIAFKEMKDLRNKEKKEKYKIHHKEIKELFSKINNKKLNIKLKDNQEKSKIINKNRLPLLHLNANQLNSNKIGTKKIFRDKNNINNYINKININTNKTKKKEDSLTIRNISVPRQKTKFLLNRNNAIINKNELNNYKVNYDYSQNTINPNIKKIYESPKFIKLAHFTEPIIANGFKNKIIEKSNNNLTNSAKVNKLKSLDLSKNIYNSINNEENNNNSLSNISTKRDQFNRMNPLNTNLIDDKKNFNYFSINKKNAILIDTNYINTQKEIDSKKAMSNIRLKSVENKLPLYQKAIINTGLDKNNISLNNNKFNIMTYDKIPNKIIRDKKIMILNNIKSYRLNEHNNIKLEKPVKLKFEFINSKNQSNFLSKINSKENSNIPFINI